MQTSFLYSSKATALTLALVSLLFSFIFTPIQQAEAQSYYSTSPVGFSRPSSVGTDSSSTGSSNSGFYGASRPAKNAAQGATSDQSSVTSLQARLDAALKQIAELKARIAAGKKGETVKDTDASKNCVPLISRTFRKGATDATTGGEVTRLQTFLAKDRALYPEGEVTGFFGDATEKAVQRFQSRSGIANSGDAHTTGFGSIGGQTRLAIGKTCEGGTTPTSTTTKSYSLSDVKSVVAKSVDPIPTAIDDEYTLYTVTLNNGTTREFKRGFAGPGVFEKAVKATGYTGDVAKLLALAKTAAGDLYSLVVKSKATNTAVATFNRPTPCTSYSIAWGDGSTTVSPSVARGTSCIQVIDSESISHVYAKAGTYTVTLTINGKVATAAVQVVGTKAVSYGLVDVMKVAAKELPVAQGSASIPTQYLITLFNAERTQITVLTTSVMTAKEVEQKFKDSGYTGDVSKLLTLATKSTYEISDVRKVTYVEKRTSESVRPYYEYTITLEDGTTRTFISRSTASSYSSKAVRKALRDTGYTGSVEAIMSQATATGSVLGVETTGIDALLEEIGQQLEELLSMEETY